MKKTYCLLAILVIINGLTWAQSITLTPNTPAGPTKGTIVFDNVTNQLKYWNGSAWVSLIGGGGGASGWTTSGNNLYNANTGSVGIGTTTPKAAFNVSAGKTVLFGADSSNGGVKLIWYGSKGALRAGIANPPRWDYENVGQYSVALGASTKANGQYSTALGGASWANGLASTALGYASIGYGDYATAIGNSSQANGLNSTAIGYGPIANGAGSMALGYFTSANNIYSLAMGYQTTAGGEYSTVMGNFTVASGNNATAIGYYNADVPNALLMLGNGTSVNRSNALTILQNGKMGIGTTSPLAPLHISGWQALTTTNARYFSYLYNGAITYKEGWPPFNVGLLVDYDIMTKNSIVSAQTVTTSDARIKNILGVSDNEQDLETLRRLKITDYRYKDVVNWGNQTFKKVIAQQVEEVYPQAVRKQTSTLPDIYCLAEKVMYDESKKELTVTLSKNYELKVGDKLEMIHAQKGKIQTEVIGVSGHSFTVKDWLYPTDKIFVYGRQVDDFRVVDYEALSILGISATQALLQRLEQAESQNQTLQQELMKLKENTNKRFEQLEALLSKEH